MQQWELRARELIRDTLAQYTWSGDSGRLDELAGAFTADGVLEIRGRQPLRGRDAIVAMLRGVVDQPAEQSAEQPGSAATGPPTAPGTVPRIVRHNLANIRFTELDPQQALVASYFTVFTEIGLDHYGRYRDVFVPEDGRWLIAHRFVSTDWSAPESVMAGPTAG